MSEIIGSGDRIEDTTDERARRAVSAFRRLQPTLSAYVRNLTGDPAARVEMAAQTNGSTDGKRIYIRPPLALGDNTVHDRRLCDERDEQGLPACPACMIREDVLVRVYHEVGHIAYGSFQSVADSDKKRAIEAAIHETGGRYAEQITSRIESASIRTFRDLTGYINEYLPFLINALEDARVDLAIFNARPGTRGMFEADTWKIFNQGCEVRKPDGSIEVKLWRDAPLNTQVMVGTLVKTLGYRYDSWFHEDVIEALADYELTGLLRTMQTVRSIREVYHLSFKVLARLRELGYCGTEMDPDPQPDPQEEQSDESDSTPEQSPEDGDQGEESVPDPDSVSEESEQEISPDNTGDSSETGESDLESGEGSDSSKDRSEASGEDGSTDGDSEGSDESDSSEPDDQDSDWEGDTDSDTDSNQESESESDSNDPGSGDESEDHHEGDSGSRESTSDEHDDSGSDESPGEPSDGGAEGEVDAERDESSHDTDDESGSPEWSDSAESSDLDDLSEDRSDSESEGHDSSGDSDELIEAGEPSTEDADMAPVQESDSSAGSDASSSGVGGVSEDEHDLESPQPSDGEATGGVDLEDDPFRTDSSREGVAPERQPSHSESVQESVDRREEPESDAEADGIAGNRDIHAWESDPEPIDSGADDGYGGTSVQQERLPDYGTPEEVEPALLKWGDHDEKPKSIEDYEAESAVDKAIIQGLYFTNPSQFIYGVKEHRYDDDDKDQPHGAWSSKRVRSRRTGALSDTTLPEQILQPALGQMRRAFTDNRRGAHVRNKKSGRVDARTLGKRAPVQDPRLFKKNTQPGKKDYFVVIGMDLSYSTVGVNLALEKRAVAAQAELLDRVGIPFAIYGHSGIPYEIEIEYTDQNGNRRHKIDTEVYLDIYHIKDPQESWSGEPKRRLEELGPVYANLDGHAMEFLRKRLEESNATDKVLLYYSDGKMPAENHDEELEILTREIHYCRARGYTLLGVGIRTDSPARHGLETVEVHEDEDLVKVVQQLGRRLAKK